MSRSLRTPLDRLVAVLGVALVLASGVVLAAYGGGGEDGAAATPAAEAVAVDRVQIKDFKYMPAAISVAVGTTITWTNGDSAPHTSTSGTSPSPDGVFDTDIINKGAPETVKASKAGTFEYYCALHPFMQATVTVK